MIDGSASSIRYLTPEEVDRTAGIIRNAARSLIGCDGLTFVVRERGDTCYYAEEDAISGLWKGQRFPVSACVSGWVMHHEEPVIIPDIYTDPRVLHDAYRPTFVRSLAMVPVRCPRAVAAIGAYWAARHDATPNELEMLQALADSAALALTS